MQKQKPGLAPGFCHSSLPSIFLGPAPRGNQVAL
jgi:hypothetical protein